jgi:hypothetical protein
MVMRAADKSPLSITSSVSMRRISRAIGGGERRSRRKSYIGPSRGPDKKKFNKTALAAVVMRLISKISRDFFLEIKADIIF